MFGDLQKRVVRFVLERNVDGAGMFTMCAGGEETLYSSCFAAMILHYVGELETRGEPVMRAWAKYLRSWQDERTGYFLGPEIVPDELSSPKHDHEHVAMHLTAHVLPALGLFGENPSHPLRFAHPYLGHRHLRDWLDRRDWSDAWLEGNNLLFIGQFLVHLRDVEKKFEAESALRFYFDWLDSRLDPRTGLWGTDGHCSPFIAMCGGYHQLLLYYHEMREVRHKERLIDTVLSLQHPDGGFHPRGGGGACEDADAVDILVNMYKRASYRRADIRIALRKALRSILGKHMPDGGFVYRVGEPFIHMGIRKTASPKNESNLFATWFRIHTIALIAEILTDHPVSSVSWNFNDRCSMGWHRPWDKDAQRVSSFGRCREFMRMGIDLSHRYLYRLKRVAFPSNGR